MKSRCPIDLPSPLPRPFDMTPGIDHNLFNVVAVPVFRHLPPLQRLWVHALHHGVLAAVGHDHQLFEHLPGDYDPVSLEWCYTDSPLVSPWTPTNLQHHLPALNRVGTRPLSPSLHLLEWTATDGSLVWELVASELLTDPPRTAFWAGALVSEFSSYDIDRHAQGSLSISIPATAAIRNWHLTIRQTPFGIWSMRLPAPTLSDVLAARAWITRCLPRTLRLLVKRIQPFDNRQDHQLFSVPLMLHPPQRGAKSTPACVLH